MTNGVTNFIPDFEFSQDDSIDTISVESISFLLGAESYFFDKEPRQFTVVKPHAELGVTGLSSFEKTGLNLTSSNAGIVSFDGDKLVPLRTGRATITARLDGAIAIKRVIVDFGDAEDSDGDGLPDDFERENGLDANDPIDAFEDNDKDGLSNLEEYGLSTNINEADSDFDGISDLEETITGQNGFVTNPLEFDTDGDGLGDNLEIQVGSNPVDENDTNLADALVEIFSDTSDIVMSFNTLETEQSRKLNIQGLLLDGTTIDLTELNSTTYTSSDLSIVSFGPELGVIFAGVSGSAEVVAESNDLTTSINITVDIFSPTVTADLSLPASPQGIEVVEDFAFIAAGEAGLVIVDVSNKEMPVIVSQLDTDGIANDIKVVGDNVYIAAGEAGVLLVDISNKAQPVLVSSFDTPGRALDLAINQSQVYLADDNGGLVSIDYSDRLKPEFSAFLKFNYIDNNNWPEVKYVAYENGYLAIQTRFNTLLIDARNKGYLTEVDRIANQSLDLVFNNGLLYSSRGSNISTLSITEGEKLQIINDEFTTNISSSNFAITDDYLMMASTSSNSTNGDVQVLWRRDPEAVDYQGSIDFGISPETYSINLDIDKEFVYVIQNSNTYGRNSKLSSPNARLVISKYRELNDTFGNAPEVALVKPTDFDSIVEYSEVTLEASAIDDVSVQYVKFTLNDGKSFIDKIAPYEATFTVPSAGSNNLVVGVQAVDYGENQSDVIVASFDVLSDTDGDGLSDTDELFNYATDVNNRDSDFDGLSDGLEITIGSDPNNFDSDGDGIKDGDEVSSGLDPLNAEDAINYQLKATAIGDDTSAVISWDEIDGATYTVYVSTSSDISIDNYDQTYSIGVDSSFVHLDVTDFGSRAYYLVIAERGGITWNSEIIYWQFKADIESDIQGMYLFNGGRYNLFGELGLAGQSGSVVLGRDRYSNYENSYYFDGVNDQISIPSSNVLNRDNFSWSLWVKGKPGENNENARLLNRHPRYTSVDIGTSLGFVGTTGIIRFEIYTLSGEYHYVDSFTELDYEWTHVSASYDSLNLKIYINGILESEKFVGKPIYHDDDGAIMIGDGFYRPDNLIVGEFFDFNGYIDDVVIHGRTIEPIDVKQLAKSKIILSSDSDNDGLSDQYELTAGLDYTDSTDGQGINPVIVSKISNDDSVEISWPEMFTDYTYNLYWSSNYNLSDSNYAGTIEVAGGSFVDREIGINEEKYYLLVAESDGGDKRTSNIQKVIIPNIESGLTSYYSFNGEASDALSDGRYITINNGTTLSTDRFDQANNSYFFDGVSGQIRTRLDESYDFTYSAWIKGAAGADNSDARIFHNMQESGKAGVSLGLVDESNVLRFEIYAIDGNKYELDAISGLVDEWTHLSVSYDGHWMRLFINGQLDNELYVGEPLTPYTYIYLGNGYYQYTEGAYSNRNFMGYIDDIVIHERALNQNEISTLAMDTVTNSTVYDDDEDGLTRTEELAIGTDPALTDTDGDSLNDGFEYESGIYNPFISDTDGDGFDDGYEYRNGGIDSLPTDDDDDDGLINIDEYNYGSSIYVRDSDGDQLLDGWEVHKFNTNPIKKNTDDDYRSDVRELFSDNTSAIDGSEGINQWFSDYQTLTYFDSEASEKTVYFDNANGNSRNHDTLSLHINGQAYSHEGCTSVGECAALSVQPSGVITTDPVLMNGDVIVHRRIFVSETGQGLIRTVEVIDNPGDFDKNISVSLTNENWYTNRFGDLTGLILTTNKETNSIASGDSYLVMDNPATANSAAGILFANDDGSVQLLDTSVGQSYDDHLELSYEVTVPANERVAIIHWVVADKSTDKLVNLLKHANAGRIGSWEALPENLLGDIVNWQRCLDSDSDQVCDTEEVELSMDPSNSDTDSDGLNDGLEIILESNPLSIDSDGDGIRDSSEYEDGYDLNDASDGVDFDLQLQFIGDRDGLVANWSDGVINASYRVYISYDPTLSEDSYTELLTPEGESIEFVPMAGSDKVYALVIGENPAGKTWTSGVQSYLLNPDLDAGLVGYFPLTNNDNEDQMGNLWYLQNYCTRCDAVDRFEVDGNAYGGSQAYIQSNNKWKTPTFTWSIWVKPNSYGQYDHGRFFHVGNYVSSTGLSAGFTGPDGKISFLVDKGSSIYNVEIKSSSSLNLNEWSHISISFDGGEIRLYINGELEASAEFTGYINYSNHVLSLGRGYYEDEYANFSGDFDDITIHNRPLETSEIRALFDGSGVNTVVYDDDLDGLTQQQEVEIGSDPLIIDTDGDGLEDGFEYYSGYLSPISVDSDDDGYRDGYEYTYGEIELALDEDEDQDGLANGLEQDYGTSLYVADHDGDQLFDGFEVFVNKTDPSNANSSYYERSDSEVLLTDIPKEGFWFGRYSEISRRFVTAPQTYTDKLGKISSGEIDGKGLSDHFDTLTLKVNGLEYGLPNCDLDENCASISRQPSGVYTTDPQLMDGVLVHRQIFVSNIGRGLLRNVDVIDNLSSEPREISLALSNDNWDVNRLGSTQNITVETGSGGSTLSPDGNYVVIDNTVDEVRPVGIIFANDDGSMDVSSTSFGQTGSNAINIDFDFTVPANSRVAVVHWIMSGSSKEEVNELIKHANSGRAKSLVGLDENLLNEINNWKPCEDFDADGVCNSEEILLGLNSQSADSDADGFNDGIEILWGTDASDINIVPVQIFGLVSSNDISPGVPNNPEVFVVSAAEGITDELRIINTVTFETTSVGELGHSDIVSMDISPSGELNYLIHDSDLDIWSTVIEEDFFKVDFDPSSAEYNVDFNVTSYGTNNIGEISVDESSYALHQMSFGATNIGYLNDAYPAQLFAGTDEGEVSLGLATFGNEFYLIDYDNFQIINIPEITIVEDDYIASPRQQLPATYIETFTTTEGEQITIDLYKPYTMDFNIITGDILGVSDSYKNGKFLVRISAETGDVTPVGQLDIDVKGLSVMPHYVDLPRLEEL
jgi:hypothetical protein